MRGTGGTRGRWLALSVVFAACGSGLFATPALADTYNFTDLTSCCTLAGSTMAFPGATAAAAVNDDGDVAGTATGADGDRHAYLFRAGEFTLLDTTPQATGAGSAGTAPFSAAADINDSDFIVGVSSDGQMSRSPFGGTHGVAWQPLAGMNPSTSPFDFGQLETDTVENCNFDMGQLDCYTAATNVNANDDVAGYGEFLENPNGNPYCWCTFPWLVPGGSRALAASQGGDTPSSDMLVYDHALTDYYSSGLNGSDQVVVSPDPANPQNSNTGAIYPGDHPIPFDTSTHDGDNHSINDAGWVVGTDDSTRTGMLLTADGTLVPLPPLSGDATSEATAINNDGDVVGYSAGSGGCPNAVEWEHSDYTDPIDLNVAAPSRDEPLLYATDISNTGIIVGQGGPCSSSSGYRANIDPWELVPGSSLGTTTTIACAPATPNVNSPTSCTLQVADTSPGATQTPSGTVSVSSSAAGTLTPANQCTLVKATTAGTATCSLTYTPTQSGSAVLSAGYSGDGLHTSSHGTTTVTTADSSPAVTNPNPDPGPGSTGSTGSSGGTGSTGGTGTAQSGGGTPGPVAAGPTAVQVTAALKGVLYPKGKAATTKALLKHGYTFSFDAPSAGRLVVNWYEALKNAHTANKPKPILIASATSTPRRSGKIKVLLKLTAKGRKLFAAAKHVAVSAQVSFVPASRSRTTATGKFTLKP